MSVSSLSAPSGEHAAAQQVRRVVDEYGQAILTRRTGCSPASATRGARPDAVRLVRRDFLAGKLRFALSATVISLGVAMSSGAFMSTDDVRATFSEIHRIGTGNVDVSIW